MNFLLSPNLILHFHFQSHHFLTGALRIPSSTSHPSTSHGTPRPAAHHQSLFLRVGLEVTMHNIRKFQTLFLLRKIKSLHTMSHGTASESLKKRVADLERRRKIRDPKNHELFVRVPESMAFLDTASMPMILTVVGVVLFAKLLMMYDDSRSQELIEQKIKNAPSGQGTVRMLTREEWEEIREVRPRTPFESKLARPNARIRTGGPLKKEDVKDWSIDVLMDAFTRVEESLRHSSR